MRSLFKYLITLLLIILTTSIYSEDHSEKAPKDANNSSLNDNPKYKVIQELCDKAYLLVVYKDEFKQADSVYQKAIHYANETYDNTIILKTNLNYLEHATDDFDWKHMEASIKYVEKNLASSSDDQVIFDGYVLITKSYLKFYDLEKSQQCVLKLMSDASTSNILTRKITAHLLQGQVSELANNKNAAFEMYLKSKELIAGLSEPNKSNFNYDLNGYLFQFYQNINEFDKARDHKKKQLIYVANPHNNSPVDSNLLMWHNFEMTYLKLIENKKANIKPNLEELIQFSQRDGDRVLFNEVLSMYRTLLLNTDDLKGFNSLFVDRFPEMLERLKTEFPPAHYIIKAYISEDNGILDTANKFFEMAEEEVVLMENDFYSSNFYKRYGQYLIRINQNEIALEKFQMSYDLAKKVDYVDFMLESSEYIESLALVERDFEKAYIFGKIHGELDKRKNEALHEDDMLRMELKSQERQMEVLAVKKADEKKRKHNLQYAIIIVAIMASFLILILVSSMTVPEWLIDMLGFFSILFLFEFITLLLDHEIHHITHGEPLKIFLIKIVILTLLFPLHHMIEKNVTNYMKKNKLIGGINKTSIKKALAKLWPWIAPKHTSDPH